MISSSLAEQDFQTASKIFEEFQAQFVVAKKEQNLQQKLFILQPAIDILEQAIKKKPGYSSAFFILGEIYLILRDLEHAIKCFKLSEEPKGYFKVGEIYSSTYHLLKSKKAHEKAIKKGYNRSYPALAIVLLRMGEHKEAIEICDKAKSILIPEDPLYFDLIHIEVICLKYLERYEDAIKLVENLTYLPDKIVKEFEVCKFALEKNKDCGVLDSSWDYAYQLMNSDVETDKKKANKIYKQIIKYTPKNLPDLIARAYYKRAVIFEKLRRIDDALDSISKAIKLKPSHPVYICLKGHFFREKEQIVEAKTCFDDALKIYQNERKYWLEMSSDGQLIINQAFYQELPQLDKEFKNMNNSHKLSEDKPINEEIKINSFQHIINLSEKIENLEKVVKDLQEKTKTVEEKVLEMINTSPTKEGDKKKLLEYYHSFRYALSTNYIACTTIASEKVAIKQKYTSLITIICKFIPIINNFGEFVFDIEKEITDQHEIAQAKRFSSLAPDTTAMNALIEEIARHMMNKRRDFLCDFIEITSNIHHFGGVLINYVESMTDRFYFEEYKTQISKVALKDASVLIAACHIGEINKEKSEDIKEQMINLFEDNQNNTEFAKRIGDAIIGSLNSNSSIDIKKNYKKKNKSACRIF